MKKHNILKVVLVTMLVFLVLSWIFPAAYFSSEYVDQGRIQMGLFDLFNYPMTSLSYFGFIGFYLILVGGFYGILYKIPAYRVFLDRIVESFKGKEMLFITLVTLVFALAVSVCGLQVGFIFFVPLIISVIILMGYDKFVAALVIIGSVAAGFAGNTFSYANSSVVLTALSLKLDYQVLIRFAILLVGVALVVFNTYMYSKSTNSKVLSGSDDEDEKEDDVEEITKPEVKTEKVVSNTSKKTTTSSKGKKTTSSKSTNKKSTKSSQTHKNNNKAALRDDDVIVVKGKSVQNYLVPSTDKEEHKIWPFVVGFILMFVLMILAFITWNENGFGVSLFDDITKSVTEFKLFGFPIFAKILGTVNSFGNWNLYDLYLPMFLLIALITWIYNLKFDDVIDGFEVGVKKALYPALLSLLIYSILVIVTYHPYQLVFYKAILGLKKGFNIFTTTIVTILAAIFNSDIAYANQSVLPYIASVVKDTDKYPLIGIISQSIYGLTMLFAPTGLTLMATLAYLNISYKDWLKNSWKLILEFFVILLIIFIILAVI